MPCDLQLLQQIADNTKSSDSIPIAAITASAGVLGALAGALASYLVAKKNVEIQAKIEIKKLQATVITTERIRWLQDIRTRLTKLYTKMDMQYNLLKRPVRNQAALDELSEEIMEQAHLIFLMIDNEKMEYRALKDAIGTTQAYLLQCFTITVQPGFSYNDAHYAKCKEQAFDALTRIGADTWEKIKTLT